MTDRPSSIGTTAAASTKDASNDPFRGVAILIVEDDELLANELRTLILGGGGSVLPLAADGDTALTILEESRPDAVLLNVRLAAGRGIDVARRLRDLDLPFVVASVFNRHDVVSAELSAVPYFSKPCQAREVVGALIGELKAHRLVKAVTSPLRPLVKGTSETAD
jgi:DNA-binding response OmpR family regulator